MDWDDIRVFVILARTGSVRGAAARLGVSHSTVSRRIERLEGALSVKLFNRLPEGYALTAEGERFLERAELVESQVHRLELDVEGRDARLSGWIRVTMPGVMASHLLMPALLEFRQLYPDIDLEILPSYDLLDIGRRDADVAIRFDNKPPEHLVGVRLPRFRTSVYATPAYLAEHNLDQAPENAAWIGWQDQVRFPKWTQETAYERVPARWAITDPLLQFKAAEQGLGIAVVPCMMGDTSPHLVRVPPGDLRPEMDGWILHHPELRTTERVRVFVRHIHNAIKEHADLVGGMRPRQDS